jgi:hypothetical protein
LRTVIATVSEADTSDVSNAKRACGSIKGELATTYVADDLEGNSCIEGENGTRTKAFAKYEVHNVKCAYSTNKSREIAKERKGFGTPAFVSCAGR